MATALSKPQKAIAMVAAVLTLVGLYVFTVGQVLLGLAYRALMGHWPRWFQPTGRHR